MTSVMPISGHIVHLPPDALCNDKILNSSFTADPLSTCQRMCAFELRFESRKRYILHVVDPSASPCFCRKLDRGSCPIALFLVEQANPSPLKGCLGRGAEIADGLAGLRLRGINSPSGHLLWPPVGAFALANPETDRTTSLMSAIGSSPDRQLSD